MDKIKLGKCEVYLFHNIKYDRPISTFSKPEPIHITLDICNYAYNNNSGSKIQFFSTSNSKTHDNNENIGVKFISGQSFNLLE